MPDMPTIVRNNGDVLANMKIVTVTWSSDPNAAAFEAFGDTLGSTMYWHAINSEYGVGPATSGASDHVHITTAPPATMTSGDVRNLVSTNARNATSGWPQADGQTLYAIFLSPMTTLTEGGTDLCSTGVEAYHSAAFASGASIPYAVLPQCPQFGYLDVIQSASHEYNEAATDPFAGSGYVGFDQDHQAWEVYMAGQDELGDACEFFTYQAYFTDMETNFDYPVQRQWSNASVLAGHNPCVPAPNHPYYNVTILPGQQDTITVNLGYLQGFTSSVTTKGFKVAAGQSRTFQVGFYSDRAVNMPWTLSGSAPANVYDSNLSPVANGTATVTIDKTTGVNGEKAYVTVTPMTFNAQGFVYIELKSKEPGLDANVIPLLVSPN